MISLSIHMVTSIEHTCVRSVIKVLKENNIWVVTKQGTVEKSCTHVLSVRNAFLPKSVWMYIWMFTAVNTSALNVESVVQAIMHWQYTDDFILERNRFSVMFVKNDLQFQVILLNTAEVTVEQNRTNVTRVTRHFVSLDICTVTWDHTLETNRTNVTCATRRFVRLASLKSTGESTWETNRTSVHCVSKVSATPAACRNINSMYTATADLMTVVTVGSGLNIAMIWSVMFIFTLVQSRTRVYTVQTRLDTTASSNLICWSHTMKVLGSYVTFVWRNSPGNFY